MKNHTVLFVFILLSPFLPAQITSERIIGEASKNEFGLKILSSDEGGYYILGATYEESFYNSEILLTKLSENHEVLWQKNFFRPDTLIYQIESKFSEEPMDFLLLENGSLLIYQHRLEYSESGLSDLLLLEVDPDGNLVEERLIETRDRLTSKWKNSQIIKTTDGGYLIGTLYKYDIGHSEQVTMSNGLAIKLNEQFEWQWKEHMGTNFVSPSIVETQPGDFVLSIGTRFRIIDETLSEIYIPSSTEENQYSTLIKTENGLIAVGNSQTLALSDSDGCDHTARIVKYNNALDLNWEIQYDQYNYFNINQVKPIKDGFLIAGTTKAPDSCYIFNHQAFLAKIDTLGNVLWEESFDLSAKVSFEDMLFYPDGRVVLTGTVQQQSSSDIYLVEFQTDEMEFGFDLEGITLQVSLFPNPAGEELILSFATGQNYSGVIHCTVYAMTGKSIYRDRIAFENYQIQHPINISGFPPGMYLLKVEFGGKTKILPWVKGK